MQLVAWKEEAERTPMPRSLDSDCFYAFISEYKKPGLSMGRRGRVNALAYR